MKIGVIKYFSIQPSLQLQVLGAKDDQTVAGTKYRVRTYLGYVQVPVKFNIQYPIADAMKIGIGVGPYVGYYLGGGINTPDNKDDDGTKIKGKSNVTASDYKDNKDVRFINPLDFGLVVAPFFEVAFLQIAPTMSFGMSNLNPKTEGKSSTLVSRNVYYGLQVSFLFGGK